jgi:hypothetical protein
MMRSVWGYVDREGCFGCREAMVEREGNGQGGDRLWVFSLSRLKTELSAFPPNGPPCCSC